MKRITRGLLAAGLAGAIIFTPVTYNAGQPFTVTVYAHGGHHGGGHHGTCQGSSSDVCYYYCNGHEAHLHTNGVCPYATTAPKSGNSNQLSKRTIKKVQKRLNKLGYSCGKANGNFNAKTKKALKQFKKDHGLKANCAIKKATLKALGLKKTENII